MYVKYLNRLLIHICEMMIIDVADNKIHFTLRKSLPINSAAFHHFSRISAMDFRLYIFLFKLFFPLLLEVPVEASLLQNVLAVQEAHRPQGKDVKASKDDQVCEKQVFLLLGGYKRKELWAMKVFDAWGKSQSGLFSGNLINFGHYEQCLAMRYEFSDKADGVFQGQHCMIFFRSTGDGTNTSSTIKDFILPQVVHIELMRQYMNVYNKRMGTALCVPTQCTARKVRELADRMLSSSMLKTTADYDQESFCNTINIHEMRSIDMFAA